MLTYDVPPKTFQKLNKGHTTLKLHDVSLMDSNGHRVVNLEFFEHVKEADRYTGRRIISYIKHVAPKDEESGLTTLFIQPTLRDHVLKLPDIP
jgi:hypothetical protein